MLPQDVDSYIKSVIFSELSLGCKSPKIIHNNSWEQMSQFTSLCLTQNILTILNSCAYGVCDLVLLQKDNFILLKLKLYVLLWLFLSSSSYTASFVFLFKMSKNSISLTLLREHLPMFPFIDLILGVPHSKSQENDKMQQNHNVSEYLCTQVHKIYIELSVLWLIITHLFSYLENKMPLSYVYLLTSRHRSIISKANLYKIYKDQISSIPVHRLSNLLSY